MAQEWTDARLPGRALGVFLSGRLRVYGRITHAKRWPTASIFRALLRTVALPFVVAGPYGFYAALLANCLAYTWRFYPSPDPHDICRSMRAHGPLLVSLESICRLMSLAALVLAPGGFPALLLVGAGCRAGLFILAHPTVAGDSMLNTLDMAKKSRASMHAPGKITLGRMSKRMSRQASSGSNLSRPSLLPRSSTGRSTSKTSVADTPTAKPSKVGTVTETEVVDFKVEAAEP